MMASSFGFPRFYPNYRRNGPSYRPKTPPPPKPPNPYFPKGSAYNSFSSSCLPFGRESAEKVKGCYSAKEQKKGNNKKECIVTKENEKDEDTPLFNLFGIHLYYDDILILMLLFFLYKEDVKDPSLFISLILLLLS